jgi:hypothetical protein
MKQLVGKGGGGSAGSGGGGRGSEERNRCHEDSLDYPFGKEGKK